MRKINLLLLFFTVSFQAQVGIGTTNPEGALDITSSTQGILIPRVSLLATNVAAPVVNPSTLGAPLTSTLVYNNATAGTSTTAVTPGYYYWDGSKWIRLNTESSWSLYGNSNTNPSINFLGTLDDNDLVFRRNNIVSGKLTSTNTSFGVNTFSNSSTTATRSVAIGVNALKLNVSGNDNTAIGYSALENNTTGSQNTAIGVSSLMTNSSGGYNVAIGYSCLERNTTGILNTAIGHSSLYNNLNGRSNTAIGKSALERNISGNNNVAGGSYSLFNNQTGQDNIALGKSALERNINGSNNIAIGTSSLYNNQATSNNISIGHESQLNNLSGERNTTLGVRALYINSYGSDNIAIGHNAFYNGNYSNSIAIGNNANVSADNQVRIGNNATTSIGGFASWTNVSDKRFKKNIDYKKVPGLDFILKLKPVVYNLDLENINTFLKLPKNNLNTDTKNEIVQTGFIAQEVAVVATEIGYDFSGVDKPKNNDDFYGLRYAEFVVPLTKAIQEQQEQIEKQQEELNNQKKEIAELKLLISKIIK